MIKWNRDLSQAPTGTIVDNRKEDGKGRKMGTTTFVPEWILVSVVDKGRARVSKTYRTQPSKDYPTGRWCGLADKQVPYAWAPWPEPAPASEDDISW